MNLTIMGIPSFSDAVFTQVNIALPPPKRLRRHKTWDVGHLFMGRSEEILNDYDPNFFVVAIATDFPHRTDSRPPGMSIERYI
jgi:uncharacterized protein (DUF2249 family)